MTPPTDSPEAPLQPRDGAAADGLASVRGQLRALFDSPSVGIAIVDGARRWRAVNGRLCQMLGYSEEELVGKTWMEVTHPDDVERDVAGVSSMLSGGLPAYATEKRYVRKDGTTVWAIVSASPMRRPDGEVEGVFVIVQDLSARRKAEEALRTAYLELDAHVTGSPLAVVQWGPDFRVTRFSKRAEEMFGWKAEDVLGRRVDEVPWVPEEDWPQVRAVMGDMATGIRPSNVNANRNLRKDGSTIHCEWYNSCLYDEDGRLASVFSRVLDVTERVRTQERLAESEARLRTILENSTDAIYLIDLRVNRFLEVSPSQEGMTGFSRAELLAMTRQEALERVHPEDRGILRELEQRLAAGEPTRPVEYRWRTKSGEYGWRSDARRFVRDAAGRPVALVGVIRDIGERRVAEERLRASEARFRALAGEMPVGVFQADRAGSCVYLNRVGAEIFGITPEEGLGRAWTDAFHPDDQEPFLEAWRASQGRDGAFATEVRTLGRDGRTRLVRVHARRIDDAAGAVTGYVGAVVDLTDERDLQARLAAASKLAGLGTLAAGLAHEMNSPLAAALASQAFVTEELRALDARAGRDAGTEEIRRVHAECVEALTDSLEATRRIAQIVQTMTTLGRADRPRGRAKVAKVIDEALAWLPKGSPRDVAIEVRADPDLEVEGSVAQLGQVLTKLVANALQAIPPGRKGRVEIRAARGGDGQVRIEVADDGVGIPAKELGRLFDPFFTTRPVGQGMGLGLPVCNAIVTAHGGSIAAASEPGKGTTFTLLLPAP
jgi:two-component system, cell cycle sensor histidine kinase and response regulator CckA